MDVSLAGKSHIKATKIFELKIQPSPLSVWIEGFSQLSASPLTQVIRASALDLDTNENESSILGTFSLKWACQDSFRDSPCVSKTGQPMQLSEGTGTQRIAPPSLYPNQLLQLTLSAEKDQRMASFLSQLWVNQLGAAPIILDTDKILFALPVSARNSLTFKVGSPISSQYAVDIYDPDHRLLSHYRFLWN